MQETSGDMQRLDRDAENATDQDVAVVNEPVHVPNAGSGEQGPAREFKTPYRHPSEKMIAGVCGGLADYFGWDPTLMRLVWVVMTLATSGGGFLAYLALWILLPVGTAQEGQQRPAAVQLNEQNLVRAAYVLIGFGAVWFLANIGILPRMWGLFWSIVGVVFWPALLIGAGFLLLQGAGKNWRADLSGMRDRVRSGVNGKVPDGETVKSGMKNVRERIPLKRSQSDRMILGVCGGVGQRLGIDANLVRLIWAAFSVGSVGVGVLVYVAVGLLLPEESAGDLATADPQDVQVIDGGATRV